MSRDPNSLAEPLGSLIRYAMALAPREGETFTVTSARRSYDEQVAVRKQNCGTSQYQIYDAPSSSCSPPTARPGTSNHQTGKAVDMGGSREWAAALLRPFHVTRPVPGEDWHYEWRGSNAGEDITRLVTQMREDGFSISEIQGIVNTGTAATAGDQSKGWVGSAVDIGANSLGLGPLRGLDVGWSDLDVYGIGATIQTLQNPNLWRRIGYGAGGLLMLLVGVKLVLGTVQNDLAKEFL